MTAELQSRYELARVIAEEAAEVVRQFAVQDIGFEQKSDLSPVTLADHEAERLLRARIESAFAQDGIVGEEYGEASGSSAYRWILDPIDGTKSFISSVPLYGTMVAVECEGRGVIGVISFPALHVSIDAMVGRGAWETRPDGTRKRAQVNTATSLQDSLVLTTDWEGFRRRHALDQLNAVAEAAWFMRTWGDCYGHYLVATGRACAMIDARLKIWDAAALQPIIEEAGGMFTDWHGVSTIHSAEGISSNGTVLDELLTLLR